MGTTAENAADDIAQHILMEPGGGRLIGTIKEGLKTGRWESTYRDAIGQPQPWRGWTVGELYAWGKLHADTWTKGVGRVTIEVGHGPWADSARAENQALLDQMAEPFVGEVDMLQNNSPEGDGWLGWTEEIEVSATLGGRECVVPLPPLSGDSRVPLEIGYCNPSTVRFHMGMYGKVARWPYGSDKIWLFYGLPTPVDWCRRHGFAGEMSKSLGREVPSEPDWSTYRSA